MILKTKVKIQVENIYKALKNGLIDGLIGLCLYKLLKNEVTLSEKTKEQLRQLNGPDFNLEFEMTYRRKGSYDGTYWITRFELSEK